MTQNYCVSGEDAQTLVGLTLTKQCKITGALIDRFSELTGDNAEHHTSDEHARQAGLTGRIAHGLLILSLTGELSSLAGSRIKDQVVSLGYDRVRHLAPIYVDQEIELSYQITEVNSEALTVLSKIEAHRQSDGALVMVATHKMKAISAQ